MDDLNLKIIWRFLSLSHGWKTPTFASRASLIHKQEHIVTRALAHLSCVVVFSAGALSQPVEISAFEAADVHPSAPTGSNSCAGRSSKVHATRCGTRLWPS